MNNTAPVTAPPPATETPDEKRRKAEVRALQDQFGDDILKKSEEKANSAIELGIKKEKDKVLNNDEGGLIGFLKALLFWIAEAFGLGDWVAGMVGQPVPAAEEKTAFSKAVAEATRETLLHKDFGSAKETAKEVTEATRFALNELKKERKIPSFTDEHIEDAAKQAGAGAAAEYAMIKQMHATLAKKAKPPETTPMGKNITDNVNGVLTRFIDDNFIGITPANKTKMIDIGSKFILENKEQVIAAKTDDAKFTQLISAFTDKLLADPALSAQLAGPTQSFKGTTLKEKTETALKFFLNDWRPHLAEAIAPTPGAPALEKPSSKLEEKVKEDIIANYNGLPPAMKQGFATLAGKKTLDPEDVKAVAGVLAPTLTKLNTENKEALIAKGDGAYAVVAEELRKVLITNKKQLAIKNGMHFNESGSDIKLLADQLAVGVTNDLLGRIPKDATPAGFATQLSNDTKTYTKEMLAKEVAGQFEVSSALGYAESFFRPTQETKTLDRYYRLENKKYQRVFPDEALPPDLKTELQKTHRKLYEDAINANYTFNDAQRQLVGKLVAEVVVETKNSGMSKEQLAVVLEPLIKSKLEENTSAINGLASGKGGLGFYAGTTVEAIKGGSTRMGFGHLDGYDILEKTAKGFANAIEKNENGAYDRLAQAQKLIAAPGIAQAATKAGQLTTQAQNGSEATLPNASNIAPIAQANAGAGATPVPPR